MSVYALPSYYIHPSPVMSEDSAIIWGFNGVTHRALPKRDTITSNTHYLSLSMRFNAKSRPNLPCRAHFCHEVPWNSPGGWRSPDAGITQSLSYWFTNSRSKEVVQIQIFGPFLSCDGRRHSQTRHYHCYSTMRRGSGTVYIPSGLSGTAAVLLLNGSFIVALIVAPPYWAWVLVIKVQYFMKPWY